MLTAVTSRASQDSNRKVANLGSTPDAVARCSVFEKTLLTMCHLGAK